MAELHSETAVEQLLGRMCCASRTRASGGAALNQSYAFVVSRDFRDGQEHCATDWWQGAGFDRREVSEFVTAEQGPIRPAGPGDAHPDRIVIHPVVVTLPEKPDLKAVPKRSGQSDVGRESKVADDHHPADGG
jgi:type III restriction enzyme